MVIVCVADLHMNLPEIEPCDVLLIAGDVCNGFVQSDVGMMEHWLVTDFSDWLDSVPAKAVFFTPGNHDFPFMQPERAWPNLRWKVLIDRGAIIVDEHGNEFKIYGSPWQREHGGWAFNLPEEQMANVWKRVPNDVDILLTHTPPKGIGDFMGRGEHHYGCDALASKIEEVKPKLVVCGHIHPGYGEYQQNYGTLVVNASHVNGRREPKNKPIRVDYWLLPLAISSVEEEVRKVEEDKKKMKEEV